MKTIIKASAVKITLFVLGISSSVLVGCHDGGIKDNKQPVGYSNYDTTQPMEQKGSPTDSSSTVGQ